MTNTETQTLATTRQVIGDRFELERELGRGASATTWLARDRTTDRNVAVKILHTRTLEDWKQLELFEREARVLAGLRHHGVPELIAHFEDNTAAVRGPELYLVMEWVDGVSLAERIVRGPRLGQGELMQLASDVLDVLVYLHGRTPPVYHRDLKPSNIVLRQDGTPVLIDFGGVCDGWRASTDNGDTIVGTVGYMPPEQYMGQVGPWSDLYALGASLLHALTGRPPADHDFGSGRLALPTDLEVHPRLRRLIDAILAPAPRDRPQSASEARRLLMEDAPSERAHAVSTDSVPQRPPGKRRLMDVGHTPRDPLGPRAELYKQMRGKYSHPAGCLLHFIMLGGTIAAGVITETVAAAVMVFVEWVIAGKALGLYNKARDRKLPLDGTPGAKLFIDGRYAVATITSRVESGERGFRLHYSFDAEAPDPSAAAGRAPVTGHFDVATLLGIANPVGTQLGVIYSAADPKTHHLLKQDLEPGL
jgi:hypothetical protein